MCLGALLVCTAFSAGRLGRPHAELWYWSGQVLLVVPYLLRSLAAATSTAERALLLAALAALQSFLAWSYSPDQFRFPDELQHLRTVQDILRTDHLYTANSYLAVSPGFPGMEVATAALRDLTGLSVFHAGVVVVSLCHVLVPLFVLGLVQELTGSGRTAAAAAVVYGTALHHPYYNTLFVYGAVALPFLLLTLWAAVRARRAGASALLVLPPAIVVVVTHHLTAAAMLAFLVVVVLLPRAAGAPGRHVRRLLVATSALALGTVGWTASAAPETFSYLTGPVRSVTASLTGRSAGARPSIPAATFVPPRWESLTTMAAAATTAVLVLLGLVLLWRSSAGRTTRSFAVLGLAYPLTLAFRVLAPGGAELATRGLTFVMVAASLPCGVALCWLAGAGSRRLGLVAAVAVGALMSAGSITAGLPPSWERIPGRFHLGGYESGLDRSVESVGRWAAAATPPDSRAACDVGVCSVVASYARMTVSTTASGVYYGSAESMPRRLATLSLDYVFVDRRMTQELPVLGVYFFQDEQEGRHTRPLDPDLLTKFDTTAGVDRLYDNGYLQAYGTKDAWR